MKGPLLTLCCALFGAAALTAQAPLFVQDFDDPNTFVYVGPNGSGSEYSYSIANSEATISGMGNNAAYFPAAVDFDQSYDISNKPVIKFTARSSEPNFTIALQLANADDSKNSSFQQFDLSSTEQTYTVTFSDNSSNGILGEAAKVYIYLNPGVANTPTSQSISIGKIELGEQAVPSGPALFVDDLSTDNGQFQNWTGNDYYTVANAGGETTVTAGGARGSNETFNQFKFNVVDGSGSPQVIDISSSPKVIIRAKTSDPAGTPLRIDVEDTQGRTANADNFTITQTLTDEFTVITYDFTGRDFSTANQYGTGGATDATAINALKLYIAPGATNTSATITFDYVAFGAEPNTTLPVSLASFEAAPVSEGIELEWVTASERDNAFFAVEMSRDGVAFAEVATVEGAGTTQAATDYDYTHYATEAGAYYFRLAQYDYDGTVSRSQVVTADLGGDDDGGFSVVGTYADAELQVDAPAAGEVTILDLRGAILARATLRAGRNAIDIAHLPAGHYVVTDGQHAVRFVK